MALPSSGCSLEERLLPSRFSRASPARHYKEIRLGGPAHSPAERHRSIGVFAPRSLPQFFPDIDLLIPPSRKPPGAIEACEAAWEFFGGIFRVLIVTTPRPLSPRRMRSHRTSRWPFSSTRRRGNFVWTPPECGIPGIKLGSSEPFPTCRRTVFPARY
jgi:hypothetical protein